MSVLIKSRRFEVQTALARTAVAAAVGMASVFASSAWAADYALIMGIGQYQDSRANLEGIDKDVNTAREMALAMGVPAGNIKVLSNGQVTATGIANAFAQVEGSINQGDRVFVYYSGHGTQTDNDSGSSRCTEGPVAHDMQMYPDANLQANLQRLASKASQIVMFNDSCFSGGAATKAISSPLGKPKFFTLKSSSSGAGQCGDAVNAKSYRNLIDTTTIRSSTNMVYVAASADNEVAFATPNGSSATQAWQRCMRSSATDANRSGSLTAEELRQCAQAEVTRMGFNQTITVVGNNQLPVMFAATQASPTTPDTNAASAAMANRGLLDDIRNAASGSIQVNLTLSKQELVIAQPGNQSPDTIEYRVQTSKPGYLYVLHVGSDGKTFDLLYPNARESNNYVQAGLARTGMIASAGPVGTSYMMAVLTEAPRKFEGVMSKQAGSSFMVTPATHSGRKNLMEVFAGGTSTGQSTVAQGGTGTGGTRYGASAVVGVRERN